jgi:uncharacterized membrane protein YphA (DoxX/SURF4 family)
MISLHAIVKTTDVSWITPTRLVMGLLLGSPIGGGIEQVLAWCTADISQPPVNGFAIDSCIIIRGIELLCGIAFFLGLLMRIFALPALLIWTLHAIANIGNSASHEGPLLGFIQLQGDWQFGVVYIVPIVLMFELFKLGSGRWSIDFWLSSKFSELA